MDCFFKIAADNIVEPYQSSVSLPNGHVIKVAIRPYKNARRLKMRYDPTEHRLVISVPFNVFKTDVTKFVEREKIWIENQILKHGVVEGQRFIGEGSQIPILGQQYILRHDNSRRHGGRLEKGEGIFYISGPKDHLKRRAMDYLKKLSKGLITDRVREYEKILNVTAKRISIKDTKSRWGSCSYQGNLNFSWRLVMAPMDILSYVVAHEVAHLVEHNHSPAFWAQVARIEPLWPEKRQWLHMHGHKLQAMFHE